MRRSCVRLSEEDSAVEQIIRELEKSDVEIDWSDGGAAYEKIRNWVDENRSDDHLHILTRQLMNRYDKARRPGERTHVEQGTLFDPDGMIPVGEAKRVRMSKAQARHLDAWETIIDEERNASEAAYWKKKDWIKSRRDQFKRKKDTLLDVEVRAFGYKSEAVLPLEVEQAAGG